MQPRTVTGPDPADPAVPTARVDPPVLAPYRPRPVILAARLMMITAAVNLLGLLLLFVTIDDVRRLLRDATPTPTPASVDTAVRVTVVGYVAFLLLFPLLTRHVTQGRNWARLATWGLVGVSVVTTLSRLGRHQPSPSRVLDIAAFLLTLAVAFLLATRPSSRWFRPR